MAQVELQVCGREIAVVAVDADHGDQWRACMVMPAVTDVLRLEDHQTVGGAEEQTAVGQYGGAVFRIDIALQRMSEPI